MQSYTLRPPKGFEEAEENNCRCQFLSRLVEISEIVSPGQTKHAALDSWLAKNSITHASAQKRASPA